MATKDETAKRFAQALHLERDRTYADARASMLRSEARGRKLQPQHRNSDDAQRAEQQAARERSLALVREWKNVDAKWKAMLVAALEQLVEDGAKKLAAYLDHEARFQPIEASFLERLADFEAVKHAWAEGSNDDEEALEMEKRLTVASAKLRKHERELERAKRPTPPDLSETQAERKAREGTAELAAQVIKWGLDSRVLNARNSPDVPGAGAARDLIGEQVATADNSEAALWLLHERRELERASKHERLHSTKRTDAARFLPDDAPETSDYDNVREAFAHRRRQYEEKIASMLAESERLKRAAGAA